MDALPLPEQADLATYKALAHDPAALETWARSLPQATPFVAASIDRALAALKTPGDAEALLARAHGFESWDAFAQLITNGDPFEDAADAVVNGDLDALQRHLPG